MILSNNNKWVLCTPAKCGSTAVEQMICKSHKIGRKITLKEATGRDCQRFPHGIAYQHGAEYKGPGKRLLLVRHPLERWSSIYWFTKKNQRWHLAKHTEDINVFTDRWFDLRKNDPYIINLMMLNEYVNIFKPNHVFKIEEVENLLSYIELPVNKISHSNTNNSNIGWKETKELLTSKNIRRLKELIKPELELFDYGPI